MIEAIEVHAVPAQGLALDDAAALFDEYRQHYGQQGEVVRARRWLAVRLADGRLRGYLARSAERPVGIALVAATPASLRLGEFWQLRDLFVPTLHRRRGVAGTLLRRVIDEARAQGALRVALTTEADNVAASRLYAGLGFEAVAGHTSMSLDIDPAST